MNEVRSEPRVYNAGGDHSYFSDLAVTSLGQAHPYYRAAAARLARHSVEIDGEIASGSVEGRSAARIIREVKRGGPEGRAMTTAGGSGGTFVTPQYLTALFAEFNSAKRTFVNQCLTLPLPTVGVQFHVPSFASAASVTQQTEGAAVADVEPTGADRVVTLTTQAGNIKVSQQLFDRGGFDGDGGGFDQIALSQVKSQLDAQVDSYVLSQALATAGVVTDAITLTIATFYADQSSAREILTDTAGTRLAGTHLFSTSDFAGWVTKQVDSANRPIILPDAGSLLAVANDPNFAGYLGIVLPGGLKWFADDNIAPVGGNTSVIIAKPSEVLVWEGDPIAFAYPETIAGTLTVTLGLRAYVAALPNQPKAIAQITGAAYPTTLV